jgi:hypothetical protein
MGRVIRGKDNSIIYGSPYNVYTNAGGPRGAIVMNGQSSNQRLHVSRDFGATWDVIYTASGGAYSRSLLVAPKPKDILVFAGFQQNEPATMTATDSNGCTNCA